MIYKFKAFQGEESSEALERLRLRLPQVRGELGLTAEEQTAIDDELGIPEDERGF